MTKEWVDFKAIKAVVTMPLVLDHYNIKSLVKSGNELRGPCPIHQGSLRTKTFTVNVTKNAFKCFYDACQARGNVLDFVAAMERCSVREAALKLQEWFRVGDSADAKSTNSDQSITPNAIELLKELIAEIEVNSSQIASHASMVELKVAAIKEVVGTIRKDV